MIIPMISCALNSVSVPELSLASDRLTIIIVLKSTKIKQTVWTVIYLGLVFLNLA